MANTLNLGNGNWGVKDGSLLGYNNENNNYKPLPFDFTRASSATRVNQQGLIETVASGVPRIDYTDANGALLLEPQRTNLVTYSENFAQWTDYNASAVLSQETIYGENAYKIVEDSTLNYHGIYLNNLFTADGTNYIWSVYVKGGERRYVVLTSRAGISSNDSAIIFDTQDGIWTLDSSSQNQAFFAENVGNGWWRIAIEGNPSSGAYDSFTIASAIDGTTYTDANYQGDGTSGIYVAFAQLEEGSYATSYIPTSGSAVTRIAEVCDNGGNDQVINSTEGVVYCEIASLAETPELRSQLGISVSGSGDNRVTIEYNTGDTNLIKGQVRTSSLQASIGYVVTSIKDFHKVALVYQLNNVQLWIDGVKVGQDLSADVSSPNTISMAAFLNNNTNNFEGKCKSFMVYDTVLTDAELQALTSN